MSDTKNVLRAYQNDPDYKERVIKRLRSKRFSQGEDWSFCISKDLTGRNFMFPRILGMPKEFADLVDAVFEGLPADEAPGWPERAMSAVPTGATIDQSWFDLLAVDRLRSMMEGSSSWHESIREEVVGAVQGVIDVLTDSTLDRLQAENRAWLATKAALDAAGHEWSHAERAAWSAARSLGEPHMLVWAATRAAGSEWGSEADRIIRCLATFEEVAQ